MWMIPIPLWALGSFYLIDDAQVVERETLEFELAADVGERGQTSQSLVLNIPLFKRAELGAESLFEHNEAKESEFTFTLGYKQQILEQTALSLQSDFSSSDSYELTLIQEFPFTDFWAIALSSAFSLEEVNRPRLGIGSYYSFSDRWGVGAGAEFDLSGAGLQEVGLSYQAFAQHAFSLLFNTERFNSNSNKIILGYVTSL